MCVQSEEAVSDYFSNELYSLSLIPLNVICLKNQVAEKG